MAILTKNTDFEKLWGEVVPTIEFDADTYTLEGVAGNVITCPFTVYNDDSGDVITNECTFTFSNEYIAVDNGNFVVADGVAAGEYTTTVTATYNYKSATVTATATIAITVIDASTLYLTFESKQDGSSIEISIPFEVLDADGVADISYNINGGKFWTTIENEYQENGISIQLSADEGDVIRLKGNAMNYATEEYVSTIYMTGKFNVCGNINSLLFNDDFNGEGADTLDEPYTFAGLFSDNDSVVADFSGMVLPATYLTVGCYSNMFAGFTSLTAAPKVLPASILAPNCYDSMFYGCTALTTAPELPATTLENDCYSNMFKGCSNLNYIMALFTTTPSATYTSNWVSGVAATGTFVRSSAASWNVRGDNGVPEGWEIKKHGTRIPKP